jgi:hypothetical protein
MRCLTQEDIDQIEPLSPWATAGRYTNPIGFKSDGGDVWQFDSTNGPSRFVVLHAIGWMVEFRTMDSAKDYIAGCHRG